MKSTPLNVSALSRKKLNKLIDQLLPRARAGNPDAAYNLGVLYTSCSPKLVNNEEGVLWFTKAANLGRGYAQFNLSHHYEHGLGVKKDLAEAARLMEQAANGGYIDAQINMGSMYLEGKGVEVDEAAAIAWYEKASEQGSPLATVNIGRIHLNSGDTDKAIEAFTIAGNKGDATAVEHLMVINAEIGNHQASKRWGMYGAQLGSNPCRLFLAQSLSDRDSPERDPEEALRYAHQAANAGDAFAYYVMGNLYDFAFEQRNPEYAFECYKVAADNGVAIAKYNLGIAYRDGLGVAQDQKRAIRPLREAAQEGVVHANYALGRMHYEGIGVAQDHKQAKRYYELAIESNCELSPHALGIAYFEGYGVPQHDVAAYLLMKSSQQRMAKSSPERDACDTNLKGVASLLNDEQIAWADHQLSIFSRDILAAVSLALETY